jgi:hypothetical protein
MWSSYTPESIYHTQKILDLGRYNGRVNLLEQPPPELKFAMYDKIAIKNRAVDFRAPIDSNGWEDNPLSDVFFSAQNVQTVQNGLRAGVYEVSQGKFSIPPQNIDQLQIIMRSIYYQYARHSKTDSVASQVADLNKKVLDYVVPYLFNEAVAYVKYCQDQSSLVVPLDKPKQVDRDFKQLEQGKAAFLSPYEPSIPGDYPNFYPK